MNAKATTTTHFITVIRKVLYEFIYTDTDAVCGR